jgi:hypothetical protein
MKNLATYDGIVDALGGVSETAELTDRTTQAVCNWRARGFFPTALYFVMTEELERRGYTAERWLWRFKEPSTVRRKNAA